MKKVNLTALAGVLGGVAVYVVALLAAPDHVDKVEAVALALITGGLALKAGSKMK
ncbi:MAG: hypothetical protein GY700_06415 [Propionibacteriaceae bacterium]|nr:hypothetical protein [Propionibacteriaceae bacterium]